jgi:hypothetical protein
MGRRKPHVEVSVEHVIHRHLWNGALTLKQIADETAAEMRLGWVYPRLGAALFQYFALEAFLNYVGEQVAPTEWKNERRYFGDSEYRGTTGNLDSLLAKLDLEPTYPRGKRPYNTITKLVQGRHGVVHPRPERFRKKVRTTKGGMDMVDARIYQLARPGFFERVKEDVESICDAILAKAEPRLPHGRAARRGRAFHGSATVQVGWGPGGA